MLTVVLALAILTALDVYRKASGPSDRELIERYLS